MKALVLAALLAIGMSTPAQATNSPMQFACDFLDIDCTGLRQPMIIYTDLMGINGLYGQYVYGEPWVFVDPDAPAHTVVHEIAHYVLWEVANIEGCTSEEAARRVHHAWDGTEYNDNWRRRYNCLVGK